MKRLGAWVCWLWLVGCTVPELGELEQDRPFSCDTAHPCAEGYRCAAGLCVARASGDGGTPSAVDVDGDGHASRESGGEDCDDALADVHPGAVEACNGRDDNCDGARDEGFELGLRCDGDNACQGAWSCTAAGGRECRVQGTQWFPDRDGDGHGARNATPTQSCVPPVGYVPNSGDCDDADSRRHPGAPERCTALDEDCDGDPLNGLNVGAACSKGACSGVRVCVADGGVECNAPTPVTRLRDGDNDGFGDRNATPVAFCQPPDGGYAADGGDCDDAHPRRYPGAPERCNGVDDNCDGVSDESTFSLGADCAPDGGCTGARACDGDGGVTCSARTFPTRYYPDEDLDSRGDLAASVLTCTAPDGGFIPQAGDCDDGDPFTYSGAPELCDVKDNDCNGAIESAAVCPAGPDWGNHSIGNTTRSWRKLALLPEGGVLAVGTLGGRATKLSASSPFTVSEAGCEGEWYSAWVDPLTGRSYLGGGQGQLASESLGRGQCTFISSGVNGFTTELFGGRSPGGVLHILGVGAAPTESRGFTFHWDGNSRPLEDSFIDPLYGMHGLSPELLFAVGGTPNTTNEPRIYRYLPASGRWSRDPNVPLANSHALRDVHVVNAKLAYAVGGGSVLRWNGTGWLRLPSPNTTYPVSGVLAFGTSSVYVTTEGGSIYRFNGKEWVLLLDINIRLRDIAGTRPDDLWVVGDQGLILHWPR